MQMGAVRQPQPAHLDAVVTLDIVSENREKGDFLTQGSLRKRGFSDMFLKIYSWEGLH
jgi:hypothetical protein